MLSVEPDPRAPHSRLSLLLAMLALVGAALLVSPAFGDEDEGEDEAAEEEEGDKDEGAVARKRFDHSKKPHAALKCDKCHVGSTRAEKTRPQHEACIGCHGEAFYTAGQETFCTACHAAEKPSPWAPMEAINYAEEPHDSRYFYAEFSHKTHLTEDRGVDSCNQCHFNKNDNGELDTRKPSHKNCGTSDCHGNKTRLKVTLDDCGACHKPGKFDKEHERNTFNRVGVVELEYPKGRKGQDTRKGKFSHKDHLRWGQTLDIEVSCGTCHNGVQEAEKLDDIQLFTQKNVMSKVCGQCHNGKANGYEKPIFHFDNASACKKCHQPGVKPKALAGGAHPPY